MLPGPVPPGRGSTRVWVGSHVLGGSPGKGCQLRLEVGLRARCRGSRRQAPPCRLCLRQERQREGAVSGGLAYHSAGCEYRQEAASAPWQTSMTGNGRTTQAGCTWGTQHGVARQAEVGGVHAGVVGDGAAAGHGGGGRRRGDRAGRGAGAGRAADGGGGGGQSAGALGAAGGCPVVAGTALGGWDGGVGGLGEGLHRGGRGGAGGTSWRC